LEQEQDKQSREMLCRIQIILEQSIYGVHYYFFKNKDYGTKTRAYLNFISSESKFLAVSAVVFFYTLSYAQTILLILIEIGVICYRIIVLPEKFLMYFFKLWIFCFSKTQPSLHRRKHDGVHHPLHHPKERV
jgi:hypothetical protein